jgi:hypothetical protein
MELFNLFNDKSNSKEPTFDKFEPFEILQKQDFAFLPTRYEIWKGGKMIVSGKTNSVINVKVITVDGEEKMEVSFNDVKLNNELANKNIYDEFVTAKDRLQLITIPNETNGQNMGIQMFKMVIGATRQQKNFNSNEPYCCNLFLQNGTIAKVTFSYSNPEKLIEFYSEKQDEDDETLDLVKIIAELYSVYAKRLGKTKLSKEEFQPLVLNMAYLEIAQAKRNDLSYDTREVFIKYTKAALLAIPDYQEAVNNPKYSSMYLGFAQTVEWDGLWNFLREYFESKLGIKIDNEERKIFRYDSSTHKRYEEGNLVGTWEALRKVVINLSPDMKNGQFSISESLSNKEAHLISIDGNKYTYVGNDPDFMFEFVLDSFSNVESFSLIRIDRNLRIDYLE